MHCTDGGRSGASPLSPTRGQLGDEDEEEEEDEFGGQETLVTARPVRAEAEFSQQDTLVIREDPGVSGRERERERERGGGGTSLVLGPTEG